MPIDTGSVCSDVYGNGPGGDIAIVGPCDASRPEHVVTVFIDSLWIDVTPLGGDAWVNPCQSPNGCPQTFTCAENSDASVVFNLTILRSADQGFFDIGVEFEDVFCSAKLDCAYDSDGVTPNELLFDPDTGVRGQTAVVAVACTGGSEETNANTTLHFSQARVDCAEPGMFVSLATTCFASPNGPIVYGATGGMKVDGSGQFAGAKWSRTADAYTYTRFADSVDTLTFGSEVWSDAMLAKPLPTNTGASPDREYAMGVVGGVNGTSVVEANAIALFGRDLGETNWALEAVLDRPIDPATGAKFPAVSGTVVDPVSLDIWAENRPAVGPGDRLADRAIVYPYEGPTTPGSYVGSAANFAPAIVIPKPAGARQCYLFAPVGRVRGEVCATDHGGATTYDYHILRLEADGGYHIVVDNGDGLGLPLGVLTDFDHFRPNPVDSEVMWVVELGGTKSVVATIHYATASNMDRSATVVFTLNDGDWVASLPAFATGAGADSWLREVRETRAGAVYGAGPGAFGSRTDYAIFAYESGAGAWDFWNRIRIGDTDYVIERATVGPDGIVVGLTLPIDGVAHMFGAMVPATHASHTLNAVDLPFPAGLSPANVGGVGLFRHVGNHVLATVGVHRRVQGPDYVEPDGIMAWTLDPSATLATWLVDYAAVDGPAVLNESFLPNLGRGETLRYVDQPGGVDPNAGWSYILDDRWEPFEPRCSALLTTLQTTTMQRTVLRGFVFDVAPGPGPHAPADADWLPMSASVAGLMAQNETSLVLELDKPKGNVWSAASPDPDVDDPVWQYAVSYGEEGLICGGHACKKRYFTAACGFDPSRSNCWLHFDASASGSETTFVDDTTPPNSTYPVIRMGARLTWPDGAGLACSQNQLGSPESAVQATYVLPAQPKHFCYAYAGSSISDDCGDESDDYRDDRFDDGPPVTLIVWAPPALVSAFRAMSSRAEVLGITLDVQPVEFDAMPALLASENASGRGPDLFIGPHDWLGSLVSNHLIAPFALGPRSTEFLPSAVEAFTYGGVGYGVPVGTENLAFICNAALVPSPAATWADVSALATTLETNTAGAVTAWATYDAPYFFFPILSAYGGYVFGATDHGYDPHDVGLDNAGALAAATWYENMIGDGHVTLGSDYNAVLGAFTSGDVGCISDGPWALPGIRAAGIDYTINPFPAGPAGPGAPFLGVQGVMLGSHSPNAKRAKAFLRAIAMGAPFAEAMYSAIPRAPAYLPIRTSMSDPDVVAFGVAGAEGRPMPAIPEMALVWGAWQDALNSIFASTASGADAFQTAAAIIRGLIGP